MSKKLELNGLWESSRMMLPQHKEPAIRNRKEAQRISRPIRDEQEIQNISAVLSLSHMYKKPIELTLYEEFKIRKITGIVTRTKHGEFRLDIVKPNGETVDWEWIGYRDVLKAELNNEWTEDEMTEL
ncbi:YolD-like family protein [Paenibacillus chondroitinus]|uniref:YolD-like family protein n=1 Tax=Paenibacillus chondroitinus TaxID=59842 RepID=A0ABU6D611_9BACL|nr:MULTISPECIES: YolD-like family protein [Paenibacillus]MCY9658171.1 YolD-like family protein [Paenibacillus anseongense]MEB4793166.1 YolD-like family protein [Paenibacillus chondroitinus]